MQEFDNIKDMLYCEIDEISKNNKLDMNSLKVLGEIVDVLKDMGTIEMFEEGAYQPQPEEEYSFANSYGRNGGYSQRRMPYYYNNNSYRNGGNSNGYSRRNSYRGYSREDAKEHMISKLEKLMNEVVDEHDRQAIENMINQM